MLENVSIIARIIAIIQSNNILASFLGHWNHHPWWHSFEGKISNFRFYFFNSNICRNSTHWKLPRCLSNCKIFDAVTHYLLKGRKWTYTASESAELASGNGVRDENVPGGGTKWDSLGLVRADTPVSCPDTTGSLSKVLCTHLPAFVGFISKR